FAIIAEIRCAPVCDGICHVIMAFSPAFSCSLVLGFPRMPRTALTVAAARNCRRFLPPFSGDSDVAQEMRETLRHLSIYDEDAHALQRPPSRSLLTYAKQFLALMYSDVSWPTTYWN